MLIGSGIISVDVPCERLSLALHRAPAPAQINAPHPDASPRHAEPTQTAALQASSSATGPRGAGRRHAKVERALRLRCHLRVLRDLCRRGLRRWQGGCGGSRGRLAAVVLHVRADEVAGGEGRAEGQLAGQHGGADDARELARVRARCCWVRAAHAEQVEHGRLRAEEGAAADGADFDAGHRDGDLEASFWASLDELAGVICGGAGLAYVFFITVMQLELSTFCAGSWPVARNMAVTIFAA